MDNSGSISAISASLMDKQMFGAQVVEKTLDYMNPGSGGQDNGMSQTYDFAKSVLGASGIGGNISIIV